MRRRTHLKALASALALPALASCGTGASSGAARLVFWSWVPGVDKAVDLWNSTHPNIQVDLQDTPAGAGGTYAKMYAAIQGGRGGPDVAQIEYQELPGFVLENGMADVGPLGLKERASEFVDWQLAQCTFEGHVYAVPQASGPMGLVYRKDVFSDLGLEPPATWDEFADAAKVVKDSQDGRYICTCQPSDPSWLTALAWQNGAQWFSVEDSEWTVSIDEDRSLEVADYWDGLLKNDLVSTMPYASSEWYSAMQKGSIVGWPSAQWGLAMLAGNAPDTKGTWRVAPLPQRENTDDPRSANWGGSATGVFANSKHQREATEFALWLNTDPDSIDLLIEGGYGWPATIGGAKGTALDKPDPFLGGQNAGADVFTEADESINAKWAWGPTTTNTYAHLADAFSAVVAGNSTLVDALHTTQEATVSELRSKGLHVR